MFIKASWLGPLALDPIHVEKEDGIHIPEPSKSVTDGMDKIFPSSGVLFKKTIKAAQELTSGTDSAAAKAAKEQVLKHLQDYRNTVLAFCGISPEEDMVLAGGNKRAKTHSKNASLSKRKADASPVPASGEAKKTKMGDKDFPKESIKLGIFISDSSLPTPDDIEPLRLFFDENYKSQILIKDNKVRDMLCNFLWYGVKCIISSKFCNERGTFVKGVRLIVPAGVKEKKLRMFKMLENTYVCVSVALSNGTDMLNGEALSAILDETKLGALQATKIWLDFAESLTDSIKLYQHNNIKEKALHVLKEKAQETIEYVQQLKKDLFDAKSAADEDAKKDDFQLLNFTDESQNGALSLLADAALRGHQPGNTIAETSFLLFFIFFIICNAVVPLF